MSEELTAKKVLQIIGEICKHYTECSCNGCPIGEMIEFHCDYDEMADRFDEIYETCKKWKLERAPVKTEWVHICRIIEDTGRQKRCVYEKEISEDDVLPFGAWDGTAEEILKEYCERHEGSFFATVERICRKAVR